MRLATGAALCAVTALVAHAAGAQGLESTRLSLSYNSYDFDGLNEDVGRINGRAQLNFDTRSALGVQIDGNWNNFIFDDDDADVDLDLTTTAADAFVYHATPGGAKLGAFLGYLDIGDLDVEVGDETASVDLDTSAVTYGLAGLVETGSVTLEGQFGGFEPDEDSLENGTFFRIGADLAFARLWEGFADFTRWQVENDAGNELDTDLLQAGVRYYSGPFVIAAYAGNASIGDEDDGMVIGGRVTVLIDNYADAVTGERLFTPVDFPF